MAPTRTIPAVFPMVQKSEGNAYKILKASMLRRLAQCQNYLWSKMVRVYAGHAYEGHGCLLQNLPPADPVQGGVTTLSDGTKARLVCSFFVPKNWCASARLKIQGLYLLAQGSGSTSSVGKVHVQVCDLNDRPASTLQSLSCADPTKFTWSFETLVPQDNEYQVKVYVSFTNGNPSNDNVFDDYIKIQCVSARYLNGNSLEMLGQTASDTWVPHVDPGTSGDYLPAASAFFRRIIENTIHLYSYRAPEVCQSWLDEPWHNTSTFTKVAHYTIYTPSRVSELTGKLYVYCTNGGAGNEVRVKLNGSVVQTFTALASGENILDVTGFAVTDRQENLITIEAKSTAASADWGTFVWGCSIWESDTNLATATAPADYVPLDEAGLRGDKYFVADNDGAGSATGFLWLMRNDRWLAENRLRHVIGDWRHRIYKRLVHAPSSNDEAHGGGTEGTAFDPATDWTRGDQQAEQFHAPKNITVNGFTDSENDDSGYGAFPYGGCDTSSDDLHEFWGYDTGFGLNYSNVNEALGWNFPGTYDMKKHGRRLGWYIISVPGISTHVTDDGSTGYRVMTRGRRCPPALLRPSTLFPPSPHDQNEAYKDRAYLEPEYDGAVVDTIPVIAQRQFEDTECHWLQEMHGEHNAAASVEFTLRGRLPRTTGTQTMLQDPPYDEYDKEGILFEVELNSVFVCDLPLSQEILDAL